MQILGRGGYANAYLTKPAYLRVRVGHTLAPNSVKGYLTVRHILLQVEVVRLNSRKLNGRTGNGRVLDGGVPRRGVGGT